MSLDVEKVKKYFSNLRGYELMTPLGDIRFEESGVTVVIKHLFCGTEKPYNLHSFINKGSWCKKKMCIVDRKKTSVKRKECLRELKKTDLRDRTIDFFLTEQEYKLLNKIENITHINDEISFEHKLCGTITTTKLDRLINKGTRCSNAECKKKRIQLTHIEKYGYKTIFEDENFSIERGKEQRREYYETVIKSIKGFEPCFPVEEYFGVGQLGAPHNKKKYNYKFKCKKCGETTMAYLSANRGPRCYSCNPRKPPAGSEIEKELYQMIVKNFGREYTITRNKWIDEMDENYRPDILIEEKNIVVEMNGDYWHCNPETYAEDYYHKMKKMTAKEIWEYDAKRKNTLESHGMKVFEVWESDFNSDKLEILNKLREVING